MMQGPEKDRRRGACKCKRKRADIRIDRFPSDARFQRNISRKPSSQHDPYGTCHAAVTRRFLPNRYTSTKTALAVGLHCLKTTVTHCSVGFP